MTIPLIKELKCSCGNEDQEKFVTTTEIVGSEKCGIWPLQEVRPVTKFKGFTCLICHELYGECDHDYEDMGKYYQCTYPKCQNVKTK